MKNQIKGFYFETTSRFNGEKILVIFTGFSGSSNRKTGNMIQTWIMAKNANPISTSLARKDYAVCGSCPQRHSLGGKCYVNLGQGVLSVYRAWQRGNYTKLDLNNSDHQSMFKNQYIRFGSYGEISAVDLYFWKELLSIGFQHTAYIHSWRLPENQNYRSFCMASVESEEDQKLAISMGWRVFRSRLPDQPLLKNEYKCPASIEAGNKLTCETCLSCNGNGENRTTPKNVAIILHGAWTKKSERYQFAA